MTDRTAPNGQINDAARQRVLANLASGHDATNPQFLFQQTNAALVLAVAHGLIDPVALARCELASRGLDGDGAWVGFAAAAKLHLGEQGAPR